MPGRKTAKRVLKALRFGRERSIHSSARLQISERANMVRGVIVLGRNSSLVVKAGATIDSDVTIGDNCEVVFGENSRLTNASFQVKNGATVSIGESTIIDSPVPPRSSIMVDDGTLRLAERVHIMSTELLVRFGGQLAIGKYTGIAYGSEIRCEERIDIGSYNMISYRVCIYDTNTHSTDWRERRRRIEHCFPEGVYELEKPSTRPVSIGDDVWIGQEVTITKGARIGNRCIVGIRTTLGSGLIEDDVVIVAAKPRMITKRKLQTKQDNETIDLNA